MNNEYKRTSPDDNVTITSATKYEFLFHAGGIRINGEDKDVDNEWPEIYEHFKHWVMEIANKKPEQVVTIGSVEV